MFGGAAVRRASAWVAVASGCAVVALLGGPTWARAQDDAGQAADIERMEREVGLLQQFQRMGLTAEQRRAMAQVIATYQANRQAGQLPGDPDALLDALSVVKDALLANQEPTPETWQAVRAARGQEPRRGQQASPLRQKALADLIAVLTEEQRIGLVMPSAGQLAQSMLGQLARVRRLPEAERPEALQQTMDRVGQQISRMFGGATVEQVQGIFQGLVDRFRDTAPQELMQQREQIVQDLSQQLQPLMTATDEQIQERLARQLSGWLENEAVLQMLTESAEVMEGGPEN